MIEKRTPIPVYEATALVSQHHKHGEIEWVHLEESLNRYLAEDVTADHDVPAFDRSPYDGFAVRASDTAGASREQPVRFEVIDHIGAGAVSEKTLGPFQAVRIMTGAQIPEGADAVVMLELAKTCSEGEKQYMELKRSFQPGDNISKKGEDAEKGSVLLVKGTRITSGVIALLATFGYASVPVVKKPVIGIIATGTELLNVSDPLVPGKIRNSNASMVMAQVKEAGGIPLYLGKISDDFEESFDAVKKALEKVDFLITTGGVSVGDFDFLPAIYEKLGAEVLFNKIAMRPGSVTTVAHLDGKLLFGLSGNPSACFVGFELFVKPSVRTWLLDQKPYALCAEAVLTRDFPKPNPFTRFVRSFVSVKDGMLQAEPVGLDKSSAVTSLADANALVVLPGGTRGYEAGRRVHVLLYRDENGSEQLWPEMFQSSRS
ncbi:MULTISPECIES: gephyrin-like molybdotransferase Glp [Bacillus]|uniref:Molybdopterin molybdenumtransferase n=1 Tax=Bacillus glycinifermentans TaxID=1664069 RepID=A0AAJ3YYB6_9BACI|nr:MULTISPECIES: gephyrin-like molybdotransferase Glp [Bacillus]KKB72313.1 molybdopterin molybdenumtransferase [Bacillus sp. TH008]MDU0072902.1 molybdopterin molybdotransferase MoeA [Bacillus sp. IG6]MED8020696.1 molybdopterin molybdotransferase MoeA [Bacillus glycinifermentans]QAT64929.1 molybdopterin molybdenumtransferase MoeA [Bacillus glycinifermentans]WKB78897.1 molybdopterin molybdotransferase MoeA [Bacillus glycinifermentans]